MTFHTKLFGEYRLFVLNDRVEFMRIILVSKLVGWVRNVILINVYLDLENPGGSGFWVGGYMSQMREWGS